MTYQDQSEVLCEVDRASDGANPPQVWFVHASESAAAARVHEAEVAWPCYLPKPGEHVLVRVHVDDGIAHDDESARDDGNDPEDETAREDETAHVDGMARDADVRSRLRSHCSLSPTRTLIQRLQSRQGSFPA
jgi:hypothetical protein